MFSIDVTSVNVLPGRSLELVFEDGLRAVVDMDRIVKSYTGVFAPLLDPNYFQRVKVDPELGTIVWPNGADVCPDVLYSLASGKPIVAKSYPVNVAAVALQAPHGNPSPNTPR
jgi:hypothetical protein